MKGTHFIPFFLGPLSFTGLNHGVLRPAAVTWSIKIEVIIWGHCRNWASIISGRSYPSWVSPCYLHRLLSPQLPPPPPVSSTTGIMSDEEHHFELKANVGVSKTYSQQAGTIRNNGWRPCKVAEVCTSKTGKHCHTKCRFVAIDISTAKKLEDVQ